MNIFQEKRKAQGWYARCSSAPDTTGLNAAAQSQAALSKESLDWYKQIYADTAGQRQTATDSANRMSALQEQSAINQNALTSKLSGRMDKQFGLEDKAIQEADNYDTVDRQNANAGRAMADVTQQAGIARDEQARSLQRAGVDPSSGRALAIQGNTGLAEAGMQAGAANKARLDTQTLGYARKMDALGLGRGLAANQATSAGVALNAGNSSVSNGMSALTPQNQATAQMGQGFGLASNSLSSAGNMYGNIAGIQNQANANNGAIWSGLGSAAGMALAR